MKDINKKTIYSDSYRTITMMKKRLAVILILLCMFCLSIQVYAKEASAYGVGSLCDCEIGVGIALNGIRVTYSTGATERASEIGCKDIVLQEKVNGSWKDIKIANNRTTNSTFYSHATVYTEAVKGRTYRAHCTHYAIFNGGTKTVYNETDELVYN